MQSEIKRLKELSECRHINKTDRDAILWALTQLDLIDVDNQPQKQVKAYPDEFEWIWSNYPKREGTQGDKKKALGCCKKRISEGETWKSLAENMQKYGKYCIAKEIISTPYVMQVQKFFGTGEHFKADWEISPPVEPETKSAFTKLVERANKGEFETIDYYLAPNGRKYKNSIAYYKGEDPIE